MQQNNSEVGIRNVTSSVASDRDTYRSMRRNFGTVAISSLKFF